MDNVIVVNGEVYVKLSAITQFTDSLKKEVVKEPQKEDIFKWLIKIIKSDDWINYNDIITLIRNSNYPKETKDFASQFVMCWQTYSQVEFEEMFKTEKFPSLLMTIEHYLDKQ